MKKLSKIWMDGKMVDWDKAQVHVLSHSLHYGSGVFEGIRFYMTDKGPAIFRLREHIDRLFYSAKAMHMKLPYKKSQIIEACKEIVRVNGLKEGYIRPLAFYGLGMGIDPRPIKINVAVAAWEWPAYLGDKPVKVKTAKFIRIHPDSTIADAKISGHYVNSIVAKLSVKNCDEALLLDYKGNIAEGPGANFFIVRGRRLITPKLGTILAGITRQTIITIAEDLGYQVVEKELKLKDLEDAEEAFFCGTAAEVSQVKSVDRIKFKKGALAKQIKRQYLAAVHGEIKKYRRWLSYC
ncbi:branched-chain amino acid transaminase [Candidatus Peregrinibacteria bacterium]|nr:branched-chain amino acid transaminase [Candidatus Peregrinibacteria bacterium]